MKESLVCAGSYVLAVALSLLLLAAVAELSLRDAVSCMPMEW